MRHFPVVLVAYFLLGVLPSKAQDVMAGADLARKHCMSCHQIGEHPRPSLGLAPAFVNIASGKGTTQTSIEVFLRTPHEVMPNYVLSEREISDVAAYIASLRTEAPARRR